MRRGLWVLAALLALSLLLTWPLVLHMGVSVPGDGIDDPALAWNLWWARHALVEQPQNPFAVDWMFWPVGINLAFYTLTLLNGLLSIPLQLAAGLVPAYNLLLLSSFVLSGYGAYLLCRSLLPRSTGHLAPFLGGCLYAFASAKLFYAALGQGNIASSQWIPFAALYILRAVRPAGRARDALLAALFLVLQAYAELTYASFLLIFAALAVLWAIWRGVGAAAGGWRGQPQRAGLGSWLPGLVFRLALLGAGCALGIAPVLANMLPDLRAEGDFFSAGGGFADVFSADLAGYALPTQMHPLLGGAIRSLANKSGPRPDGSSFPIDKGQQIYVGYTALALAAASLLSGRPWRVCRGEGAPPSAGRTLPGAWFWAASAGLFFLLTLGPSLRVAGRDLGIPLPFALVAQLAFFKGNRYPSRYSVMLLVSLAPLVAAGAAWAGARLAGKRVGLLRSGCLALALLGSLLLFEHLSVPLPLFDLSIPVLYERIAQEPGDSAVLEIPLGWRNGARVAGKQDIVIMQEQWYQTLHGKRLLGGNTSRNPEFKFQYFAEDPTLAWLVGLTRAVDLPQNEALRAALAGRPVTEADRTRARAWAAFLGLRFVVVHRDKVPPETEEAVRALLPLQPAGSEGDLALYRLPAGALRPRVFDLGSATGRMAAGEGWSPAETVPAAPPAESGTGEKGAPYGPLYAERAEVRLLLPLEPGTTRIRLHGQSLVSGQTLSLVVDGRPLPAQPMSEEPGWTAFDVPAGARPPLSDVRLRFARLAPAVALDAGPWPVARTGVGSPVSVLVRSAGQETGDFAHIYVDGEDLSPGQRGYNLVALDPGGGRLLGAAAFDTHADAGATVRLAAWVAAWPDGTIIAGAARDEASLNLGEPAVIALRSLGVQGDLRGHFRWSHAFVGVRGALHGTALEAIDGLRPAQVNVGWPLSARQVAAAISRVEVGESAHRVAN